ncbi:MAG: prolyl oligopeptidase family serine peptidase, partial [Acidimicrobiales bacterium]
VILLSTYSSLTSEVRWLPADRPEAAFQLVTPREQGVEYYVDHRGEDFWVLTNREARNFRVMRTLQTTPGVEHWQEVVAHRPEVRIEAMDLFRDRMVLTERAEGLSRVRVLPFDGGRDHFVPMPETVYSLFNSVNMEFDTPVFSFGYNSLITPRTIFDYRAATRELEVVKREKVLGGYDPTHYATERLWTTVADEARVPISIAYKKGLARDGRNPCLLTGYGAYGASYDPDFSPHWLSLLDRGFVFAIAHVRGGGEMGKSWHEAGRLLAKRNTFTDFIAAAEHLVATGWTASDRLAIRGTSAGGLLMGAVTTMRPDLFAVVVARVPFVDVINTMLDESIPLVVIEFEEWGNPEDEAYFDYM